MVTQRGYNICISEKKNILLEPAILDWPSNTYTCTCSCFLDSKLDPKENWTFGRKVVCARARVCVCVCVCVCLCWE
jgi:hypothetical protein